MFALEQSGRTSALTLPGPDHFRNGDAIMAKRHLPPPELLRQLLDYNPETGGLSWRQRSPELFETGSRSAEWRANNWNAKNAGRPAFTANDGWGYKTGAVFGRLLKAHHVAWAYMTGGWPVLDIDHINGDRSDNRWVNLREVSRAVNLRNAKRKSTNTSGHNGVRWRADCGKWRAEITLDGRNTHLGYFADLESAVAARKAAEVGHGFTARHGLA